MGLGEQDTEDGYGENRRYSKVSSQSGKEKFLEKHARITRQC